MATAPSRWCRSTTAIGRDLLDRLKADDGVVFNLYTWVILSALAVAFALDLITNGLNLRWLGRPPPPGLGDLYDPDRYRRSQLYTRARTRFGWVFGGVQIVLFLAFWAFGGFAILDRGTRSLGWPEVPTGLLYLSVLGALGMLVTLPFDLYSVFVLEERFGFNRTTLRTFVLDRLKGLLVLAVAGVPLAALVLWFFSAFESVAWLLAWAAVALFLLVAQIVFPTWILPLFHRLSPLEDGALRDALVGYAKRVDFPIGDVVVVDGSRRSAKSNAFFTGLGRRRRIALFDTLLGEPEVEETAPRDDAEGASRGIAAEPPSVDEVVAIVAHEVGHAKKGHIPIGLALGILHSGAMLFVFQLFLTQPGLYRAFSVDRPSVHVGLVLFGFLAGPLDAILSVAASWLSRLFEFQADRFAVETTRNPRALADALRRLARTNLTNLTPHPLLVALRYSHPPLAERLAAIGRMPATGEAEGAG